MSRDCQLEISGRYIYHRVSRREKHTPGGLREDGIKAIQGKLRLFDIMGDGSEIADELRHIKRCGYTLARDISYNDAEFAILKFNEIINVAADLRGGYIYRRNRDIPFFQDRRLGEETLLERGRYLKLLFHLLPLDRVPMEPRILYGNSELPA